ncbi:MAG: hypothetical protein ACRD59_00810 [Candidatus Acidiferrales bacterium]
MNFDRVTGRRLRPKAELLRHARKCCICNHARRADIEFDFLIWRTPSEIVREYSLAHHSAIYRHAEALGLTELRDHNARTALDYLIEQAESAPVTGNTIIRAIRAYSCLDDRGHWTEPPKHVIFESRKLAPPPPASRPAKPRSPSQSAEILIANTGLENAATR